MSKKFKLFIALIITTYNLSFVYSQFYSERNFLNRLRKSGTRPRSLKINWPRKAFGPRDRKALQISDIYTDKFLRQIESRIPQAPGVQQWQAAVETWPKKKENNPEMIQKSRQEENKDMSQSEELSSNVSEEQTNKQKYSQKEIQQLKEHIRKEKLTKEDWKKKEEALANESPEPELIKSKELKSEQIGNHHYSKPSQTAIVESNFLRGGHKYHSGSDSKQHDKNYYCVKKCYSPKCEVECTGRKGSAACSANKCKARSHGADSAAVCQGKDCQGLCYKSECIAACEGHSCAVKCEGKLCHAVAEGRRAQSSCAGESCVAYGKGPGTGLKCEGKECQTWCVGDDCVAKCHGANCEAMCSGNNCKSQCVGKNCTQIHRTGVAKQERPWVLDKEADSKSQEISISDENGGKNNIPTKLNDDDDGYFGNKKFVKKTINVKGEEVLLNRNKGENKDLTLDYSMDIQLSKRLGEYLRKKVLGLKDLSLLMYLPRWI